MPNPLYQQLCGGQPSFPQQSRMPAINGPFQRIQAILTAMQNPAAFVKQMFPDIPPQIQNDPNQTFQYLQQTRGGVDQSQINQAMQMAGQIRGQGSVR